MQLHDMMKTNRILQRKERERFLIENFIRKASLDATIVEDREAPDFILCVNGESVGVEVTELFISDLPGGDSLQAREAISSQIAAKAQRLYQAAMGKPAHVSICFNPGLSLRNINRDKAAHALCNFVLGLDITVSERIDWRPEDEEQAQLPEEFSFVHVLGVPEYDFAHWAVARAGWVSPLKQGEPSIANQCESKANRVVSERGSYQLATYRCRRDKTLIINSGKGGLHCEWLE